MTKNVKAISVVTSVLLMIAVAVVAAVVAYAWVIGYLNFQTVDRESPLNVEISSSLYSTDPRYGVLGDNTTFNFHITNSSNETQRIMIMFRTEENEIWKKSQHSWKI